MKEKYKNFKDLLKNILVHLVINNQCILRENSNVDGIDQVFSKADYFIDVNDSRCFVFKGDFTYLLEKINHLVHNSDLTFAGFTQDKYLYISQSLDQILHSVKEQEMVRFWTMKISKEFMEIYEEYNLNNVLEFYDHEFEIIELEASSWMTQIKNLLCCRKSSGDKCLLSEKMFWMQFKENLKILEYFFNSNQFKFMYRAVVEYNLLIAKSTFDSVRNLSKYRDLHKMFNEYYGMLDLESLYQSHNVKMYQKLFNEIVEIIIQTIGKQPISIRNSLKDNLNGILLQTIGILKKGDLKNDFRQMRSIITDTYRLFHSIHDSIDQASSQDELLIKILSELSAYSTLCIEYEHCIHSFRVINALERYIDPIFQSKVKEYMSFIQEIHKKLDVKNFDTVMFETVCLKFVISCFKDIWVDKSIIFDHQISSCDIELSKVCSIHDSGQDLSGFMNSKASSEDETMNRNFCILKIFQYFLRFERFLKETIIERSCFLDYLNRCLITFSTNLNCDGVNLVNEIGLYLGFISKLDNILSSIFNSNDNLVLLAVLKEKIKMIDESLFLRLNLRFEMSYNNILKKKIGDLKLITVKEHSTDIFDSLEIVDLSDIYLEVNYFITLNNILDNSPKSKSSTSFINSVRSSHFYLLIMQEMEPCYEFRNKYFEYLKSITSLKRILIDQTFKLELYKDDLENIFKEIKKIYNLKIKYLLLSENGLGKAVNKLNIKYTEFIMLTTRLNLHKNFKGRFTFNPSDYCLKVGHSNTLFFKACVEASYGNLVINYFQDTLNRISNNEIYKEVEIIEDEYPDLEVWGELLENIFPNQDNISFFDKLKNNVKINQHIIRGIESLIDAVFNNVIKAKKSVEYLYGHIESDDIMKQIKIYDNKIEIINSINDNRYPCYKFISNLTPEKYNSKIESLVQILSEKRRQKIQRLMKKSKVFLSEDFDSCDVFTYGKFLKFYCEFFKKSFKKIKKIKINNLNEVELLDIEEVNMKFKRIYNSIEEKKEQISRVVYVKISEMIDKLELFEREGKYSKADLESIEEEMINLDQILMTFNEPLINRSKIVDLRKSLEEKELVSNLLKTWDIYKKTSLKHLNIEEVLKFTENLESPELLAHNEINSIYQKKDMIKSISNLFEEYVTKEYFDTDINLDEYLMTYTVDRVMKIVNESRICYKTLLALKRIKETIFGTSFVIDEIILNFEETENDLFNILAECNALMSYNKIDRFVTELKNTTENVYKMIRISTRLREVQDINLDLRRIMNSGVFELKRDKFVKLNRAILELIEAGIEGDSRKYPLRNMFDKEEAIEALRSNAIELQLYVKNTIVAYREVVHRLYFISDEDILSLLCQKKSYHEYLVQMYNIDEVICEKGFVKGFKSNKELVYLSSMVDLSLDVVNFFAAFADALKETLIVHLKASISKVIQTHPSCDPVLLSNIKVYCGNSESSNAHISVIDDFVNEFCYFNNLPYVNSTKLKYLIERDSEWNGNVNLLYPKPRIINGKLVIEEISTKDVFMEYYPPSDMVFTGLTSSIFSLISIGLSKMAGVILFGKSGTGKTETVKYYCRAILRPVYVFCCSEECDISTLENIIIGCIKMGAYLCLDEFNRLKKHTMSSVTELIFKNKDEVKFFLTMNLGYSGRNELPKSLQSIFTEIRVDSPDIKDIVSIFFGEHSQKITSFLRALEDSCEKLEHYNFGLRAIKTIMDTDIDIKGLSGLLGCEVFPESLLIYSFYIYYYATLSNNDKRILNTIFFDIFGLNISNTISYEDTFNFGVSASSGMLIYGKARSRKSSLIKDMASKNNITIEYYNPPNTANFFGTYDEVTGEWVDSEFVTSIKQNKDKETWYVFDCLLDSNWIENFNSVLDDNKSLCLKSGEVIKIGSKIKFIFEGDDLDRITPATLTRMFTIYIEDDTTKSHLKNKEEMSQLTSEMLEDNKVIYLKGTGILESLKNIVAGDNFKSVDASDCKAEAFFDIFKKEDLITRNNKKMYVGDVVLYIENFEKAGQRLQEFIREYAQYGKIGDVFPVKLKLLCGFESDVHFSRLEGKAIVVRCKNEPLHSQIHKELAEDKRYVCLYENLKISKQFEKFTNTILQMFEKGFVEYHAVFNMCHVLSLALSSNPQVHFVKVFYYISLLFSKGETLEVFISIWECEPETISYDPELGFIEKVKSCVKGLISFLLSIQYPFILVGPRLSSKRFLVDSCAKLLYSNLKIYNFYDRLELDHSAVYLLDSTEDKPSRLLRKSIVCHLDLPMLLCLDYDSFCSSFKDKSNRCVIYGLYEEIEVYKASCTCCCLDIPETRRFYWKDKYDTLNKEDFFINELIKKNPKHVIMRYGDLFSVKERKNNTLILFDSLFKYRDFVETASNLYKKAQEEFNRRRLHIEEGFKRINKFKEQASDLLSESIRKKQQLEQLQSQVQIKMEKMVEIQILMKVEKERIYQNQNELDIIYKESMKKKKMIDLKMKDIIPLLEKSKSKISSISKKHLAEIKTMMNPPEIIKFVIELVYTMLENTPDLNISWSSLLQYIRRDDFMSKVMNFKEIENLNDLERILQGRTMESKNAYKASQACGILYDWIVANFEYTKVHIDVRPLLDETKEIDMKIQNIRRQLEEEERKYKDLENEISASKEEYSSLKNELDDLKREAQEIEQKQIKINTTLELIHNETDNWHLEEPVDVLSFMLSDTSWYFTEKKNLFISRNQKIEKEVEKHGSFLETSTKHKNFLQVLKNVQIYNSDVLIYDVDEFYPAIYELLKHQMKAKSFSIILISNFDKNFYPFCTYRYEVHDRLSTDRSINLKDYEQNLMNAILEYKEMDEIIRCKLTLDKKREEYAALESLRDHYSNINKIYSLLDLKYKQFYSFGLSFDIFKSYLKQRGIYEMAGGDKKCSVACGNSKDDEQRLYMSRLYTSIEEYFNLGLPDNKIPINIREEFLKNTNDLTIISNSEDIIYEIERNLHIEDTISAGSTKNNEKVAQLFNEQFKGTFLIKNVNYLEKNITRGHNRDTRFIFVSEGDASHNLIYNTRILYNPREVEIEEIKRKYLTIFNEDEGAVEYHCKLLETKQVSFKDLLLIVTSKNVCSEEYLRYLIYETKY